MRIDVRYRDGEPVSVTGGYHAQSAEYKFTIEGATARLVDVRAEDDVTPGQSVLALTELNQVHDTLLELPFIDRVTVWMKGRTDTEPEQPTAGSEESA